MKAEIINIGTELLLGHIVNTNAAYLSQKLAELGIDVYHQSTVGDNPSRLIESIRKASQRSDIVIMTGGLGPTVDDITVETLSNLTRKVYPKQICNKVGSAPGLMTEYEGSLIICLPGPPRELEPMFENDIAPILKKKFKSSWLIKSRTMRTTGLAESKVNQILKDILKLKPPTTVGIYAKLGEVYLNITAKAQNAAKAQIEIQKLEKKIRAKLKDHIFGYDKDTLESSVAKLLTGKKLTIATAESCTGGLLAHRLTNISGASAYFTMGVAAYANEVKVNILGVREELIKKEGAVSGKVAQEMASGIRLLAGTDIGISITGVAGPKGGTGAKPVGLVYIALDTDKERIVKEFRFKGSREEIKFQATQAALNLIRQNI